MPGYDVKKAVRDDVLKVAIVMLVSRVLNRKALTDAAWIRTLLFTLMGVVIYEAVARRYIQTSDHFAGNVKTMTDDWLRIGTILLVTRILREKPLYDRKWIMECLFTLLGFGAYDLFVHKLAKSTLAQFEGRNRTIAGDIAKVTTMLGVSHWLSGQNLDMDWLISTLVTLGGFTTANVVLL